jgi:FG-GAP-like repeat
MLSREGAISLTACLIIIASAGCGGDGGDQSGLRARDIASEAGIARTTETHGENCVFDYNGDGILDLFLSNHDQAPWQLFQGLPDGKFVETNRGTFPLRDRHGCATADFNGDGRPDIYASIGACMGTCQADKELWIQTQGGTFTDQAKQFGLTDPGGRGRLPVALNANGDRWPDLFAGQSVGVKYPSPNRLWVNVGGDRFVNPPGLPTQEIDNQCDTAGDFDGDGLDELIVCSGEVTGNAFYIYDNRHGKWSIANKRFGVPSFGRSDAQLADLNGDGKLDLVTVTADRLEVRLNRSGRFPMADYSLPLRSGWNLAVGDANGDGHPDIYVLQRDNGTVPDLMLLNRGGGTAYSTFSDMPQATSGEGDTVQAIPGYKGTRRAAFLVNNGFEGTPGPRQLIVFEGG